MDIPRKSIDDMVREIIASLRAGTKGRPRYTLVLGSGFSFPIVPTARQMVEGDVAWWRYHREKRIVGEFCRRDAGAAGGLANENDVAQFERDLWKQVHATVSSNPKTSFPLAATGLPDLTSADSVGLAYQALMANGLFNIDMRRQYLRDAIKRSGRRVNGAHIFLASILEAQEEWDNGSPFCRTIFTTNFDPLLQRSLQIVNKLYYMSDRPSVLDAPDDDESDAIHLIYTHGSVHRYDLLNTEDDIAAAREQNAAALTAYFRRRGVIVIGYSGWADTTMTALLSCASFDFNLYWCDIHPFEDGQTKLRPEVQQLLKTRGKNAFYVPIKDAGEPMRLLHSALNLNPVPKFIRSPVETMMEQLRNIDVSSEAAAAFATEATSDSDKALALAADPSTGSTSLGSNAMVVSADLKTILDGTLTRLQVAQSVFQNPAIVESGDGKDDVAKALVAQLLNDALVAYWQGKRDDAVRLWTSVIDAQVVPPRDRAVALYSRGVTHGDKGDSVKAIADYTAVIEMPDAPTVQKATALGNRGNTLAASGDYEGAIADFTTIIDMPDAPAEQKARALYNRGVTMGQNGHSENSIADYTAVIAMPDADAKQKAKALFNRGVRHGLTGDSEKEIADYTAVIDMSDAPAEEKAKALRNRGITWGQCGDSEKEIADYTAVIDMPDAPAEEKAKALRNRGLTWGQRGDSEKEIADYTAVIVMPDAPAEQKARALYNRGVTWGERGDSEKEIADYTAVIEMPDAPTEQKAKALRNRGVTWGQRGNAEKEIGDYTAVIDMPDAPAEEKAKALFNRGITHAITGDSEKEIADYTAIIDMPDAPAEQKAKALFNRGVAWEKSGDTEKAIADYSVIINMSDAPTELTARAFQSRGRQKFASLDDAQAMIDDSMKALDLAENNLAARSNLALGLLVSGQPVAARREYDSLLSRTSDDAVIRTAINDIEWASRQKPDVPDAEQILDLLRGSLHAGTEKELPITPPASPV